MVLTKVLSQKKFKNKRNEGRNEMKLKEAEISSIVKVVSIDAKGELRRRFFDLGIIEGTIIEVLYRSPFGDPTAFLIRGAVIAMREEESEMINVASLDC